MSQDFDNLKDFAFDDDVEVALRRQDEALSLLERLRTEEPFLQAGDGDEQAPDARRGFRRWVTPPGVTVELHDGDDWCRIDCSDLGVGGARTNDLPKWANGPTPTRLKAFGHAAVIALADVMWRDGKSGKAGLRFEFQDEAERDYWTSGLVDALLARHAVG